MTTSPTAPATTAAGAPGATRRHTVLLLAAIFAVALNLRTGLASVPPLVHTIQADLGLHGFAAGMLTALPVVCMGAFAPPAQRLAQRIGNEPAVAIALLTIVLGLALRLAGHSLWALFTGTFLNGLGVAIAGTLLPALVKEFFPGRAGAATGVYFLAMMVGATASSSLAVPIATSLGSWQRSLGVWSVLGVVALGCWLPVVAHHRDRPSPTGGGRLPWRDRTAILLTTFMALNSIAFYSCLAWIAASFVDRGFSAERGGVLLGLFSAAQIVSGLAAPVLADRFHDRRPLALAVVAPTVAAFAGLVVAPMAAPWVWVGLLGIGLGGAFPLSLALVVDAARTPSGSSRLSAMAFLVSYCLAAVGPPAVGAMRDATGGFTVPFAVLLGLAVVELLVCFGLVPGRQVAE